MIQNFILGSARQVADTTTWLYVTPPHISDEENVWFDRKSCPVHIYDMTRTPHSSVEKLTDYLQAELKVSE